MDFSSSNMLSTTRGSLAKKGSGFALFMSGSESLLLLLLVLPVLLSDMTYSSHNRLMVDVILRGFFWWLIELVFVYLFAVNTRRNSLKMILINYYISATTP